MKLREPLLVPRRKVVQYLLDPRPENDKAGYFALAGYSLENWEVLRRDLTSVGRAFEVASSERTPWGTKRVVRGRIRGPNGAVLRLATVWIELEGSATRLVTAFPERS